MHEKKTCVMWAFDLPLGVRTVQVFGLDFSREQLLRASSRQYSLGKSCYNNIE